MTEQFYTLDEAAKMLKINRLTLCRQHLNGRIQFIKIGRTLRISGEELDRFIKDCTASKKTTAATVAG